MANSLNKTVNELTALEVMGWVVLDGNNSSYKDESNLTIENWNPIENVDHALRVLAKVRRDGYNWRIEPNKQGVPRVIMIDKGGQEMFATYNSIVTKAICIAVLNHYTPGWYGTVENEVQA